MGKNVQLKKTPAAKQEEEVKFGQVTYISQDIGAFVKLLASEEQQQVFVPKEKLLNQNVSLDSMVQITKRGNEVTGIKSVQ